MHNAFRRLWQCLQWVLLLQPGKGRNNMAPDSSKSSLVEEVCGSERSKDKTAPKTVRDAARDPHQIIWLNAISIIGIHVWATYTFITRLTDVTFPTVVWAFFLGSISGFGVTGGVHRLWTHRSYKAKWPLRVILAICYSVAGQNTIYDWVRDHRVHHKYSETDADPHDARRGFFFAHVGWLMMRKHPEVIAKGRQIDMSDVLADPVVQFHQRHFVALKTLLCFAIPVLVPILCWGEAWYSSLMAIGVIRYLVTLNCTWLVNSAAHIWGNHPFDKRINPAENIAVAVAALGEGWHNYHHVFPWDYKAAELGNYAFNVTTFWIDLFAKIGWAYDLKAPSEELVRRVAANHGDGSHPIWGHAGAEVPEECNLACNNNDVKEDKLKDY